MKSLVFLIALCVASVSAAQTPSSDWLFAGDTGCSFNLTYGRFRLGQFKGLDHQRQAVEYANGATESYHRVPDTLNHERTIPGEEMSTLSFEKGSFRFTKSDFILGTKLAFTQPATGQVVLSVSGKDECVLSGPSIWHLYLQDPERTVKYLQPVVKGLRISLDLEKEGEQLVASILQNQSPVSLTYLERVSLVNDLGSDSYDMRNFAHRTLREYGPVVFSLADSPLARSGKEQELRLSKLREEFELSAVDRRDRVAKWLSEDPWVWGHFRLSGIGKPPVVEAKIEELTGVKAVEQDERTIRSFMGLDALTQ